MQFVNGLLSVIDPLNFAGYVIVGLMAPRLVVASTGGAVWAALMVVLSIALSANEGTRPPAIPTDLGHLISGAVGAGAVFLIKSALRRTPTK